MLQSRLGRHVSRFSEQPTLRSPASNLASISRVAQEEDMFPRLRTPLVSVCLSFLVILILQLSDRRIHRTISSDS